MAKKSGKQNTTGGKKASRSNATAKSSKSNGKLSASALRDQSSEIGSSVIDNVQSSFEGARSAITRNANLQNAGLALAGAGIVALFSTKAGRSLVRAGAEAVISLVNTAKNDYWGSAEEEPTEENTRPDKPFKAEKQTPKYKSQI